MINIDINEPTYGPTTITVSETSADKLRAHVEKVCAQLRERRNLIVGSIGEAPESDKPFTPDQDLETRAIDIIIGGYTEASIKHSRSAIRDIAAVMGVAEITAMGFVLDGGPEVIVRNAEHINPLYYKEIKSEIEKKVIARK